MTAKNIGMDSRKKISDCKKSRLQIDLQEKKRWDNGENEIRKDFKVF
jgi:hypothetical protein